MQSSTYGSLVLALDYSQSSEGGMEVRLNFEVRTTLLTSWPTLVEIHNLSLIYYSHDKTINSNGVMLNDSDLRAQRYNATRRGSRPHGRQNEI